ncbi:uncharacterized protein LOC110096997 isoform X2 [Dendrobium catenatum]|uniref:uncharacterized protein LOC110096997 isoform X2 n=1 Tax=Dendrobium catenatum TaxID=906689 RepID=UPI0009F589FA|nr:uncharacterized protein LOC110096997 isoform X2 [Dendrobium catenatum]XP_020678840.1 uncharacterized protein LOC110096997 isoform X2 [Dendrobium catenatum]XP_020678842.1 uncharacterized protein LOC110096997 isoform X2 [Dendrobium catenatum]
MIQFCTCNKRIASPLEIPEGQENPKSCKSCGGIISVGKLGGLSRRTWSTMGPEFSGVIDPQLKWKTSSNGKHRALRRARTFTQDNGRKFTAKNKEDIKDFFDEASKKKEDMLVLESEKLGVSVLGQRFSDNLESVPIKKRRFSLLPQSTSHILSSSGFHDHSHGRRLALFQNNQVSLKQDEFGVYSSKSSADKKTSLEDIDEHLDDSADFSGISILAAAACYSSIENGLMDGKGPTVKGHSFEENPSSLRFSESLEGKGHPSQPELGSIPKPSVVTSVAGEAFDRETGQVKFDGCKEEHSLGSLQKFSRKRNSVPSLDDRLHWDLNTVMDVWESNDSHDIEHRCQGLGEDEAGFGIDKVGLKAADNQNISYCFEKMDGKHANAVADCDEEKVGSPETQGCEPLPEQCHFKGAKVTVENAPEKTNPAGGGEKSCVFTRNTYPIEGIAQSDKVLSTKVVDVSDKDKYETDNVNFSVEVDTHNSLPSLISAGNTTLGLTMNASDPFSEDKNVNELFHGDSLSIATLDSCNDHSGECHPAYLGKSNQLRSPPAEKHQSVLADVVSITSQKSPAGQLDQSTSGIIIHGDEKISQVSLDGSSSKSMTTYGVLADETAYIDEFGKAYANSNQSIVHFNFRGISDNELLLPRNTCSNQYKESSTDLKVDECKSSILSGECLNASTAVPIQTSPKFPNSISEVSMLERNDIPLADDIVISHEEYRTPVDGHVRSSVKDSLEEHFDSGHFSDPCPVDTDHAIGLEKFEFLGEDDSQYEDGELRESVLNSWGEDGVEELETEHVDYGSDCREADFFEADSDFCSQSDLVVVTTECKHEGKLVSTFSDGDKLRVTEDELQPKCFQKHSLVKDASNVSYGEGDARENLDVTDASELPATGENRLLKSNIPTDRSDDPGKSSQPESSRMKSSGWDKLPRREVAAVDSPWNHDSASVTASVNGEYARKKAVSSLKRDSYSRLERSKSSEASCRKEVSYTMENKKLDHFDLNAERSTNGSRSIGRNKLPFRSHDRGRVEYWVGSPDHHGSCRFDTSGYYSSPNFAPSGARNAAAAAVAKVESNGFVVAPDGTIVRAGSMGSGPNLSSRSINSSSHLQSTRRGSTMESDGAFDMSSEPSNSTREVSPDRFFNVGRGRPSRHGSRLISLGHRNMYQGPIPLQPPSSRRQQSFSPHRRRPIHFSREHTRSPSRSKTRSPHTWTSPRGRDNGRISGVHDTRRQSRSPQRRMPRQRSLPRQGILAEELASYSPSSRGHSRWFDSERILQGQPRCPTGRSSPARIFSQSDRFDHIDSRGRAKPDEYYQPVYSERFHEYDGYGRDDGSKGRSNRYELLHSEGHGNMKCFGYGENGIRAHSLHRKASGFQRRESTVIFDRSIDAQRKDPHRRIKGEMVHFRRGRDVKLNTEFNSFEVEDSSNDMALQRRPS